MIYKLILIIYNHLKNNLKIVYNFNQGRIRDGQCYPQVYLMYNIDLIHVPTLLRVKMRDPLSH